MTFCNLTMAAFFALRPSSQSLPNMAASLILSIMEVRLLIFRILFDMLDGELCYICCHGLLT